MTRQEQLVFCTICEHKKLDSRLGLICSLTNNVADFNECCPDFKKNPLAEQSEFNREMAATGDYQSGGLVDYKKKKLLGLVILILGLSVTMATFFSSSKTGFSLIAHGAIVYGAVKYYQGVQQEKIVNAFEKRKSETD